MEERLRLNFSDNIQECELLFQEEKCIQKINIQITKEVVNAFIKTLSTGWKIGQDKRSFTFHMKSLNDEDETVELIEVNSKSPNKEFLEKVMKLVKVSNGVFHYEINPEEFPKDGENELEETDAIIVEGRSLLAKPISHEVAIQTDPGVISTSSQTAQLTIPFPRVNCAKTSTMKQHNNNLVKNFEVSKKIAPVKLTDDGAPNSKRLCRLDANSSPIIEHSTSQNCITSESNNHPINSSVGKENENPIDCSVNENNSNYWKKEIFSTPLSEIVQSEKILQGTKDRILRELPSLNSTSTDNCSQNRPPVIIRNDINSKNERELLFSKILADDFNFPDNDCSIEIEVATNVQQVISTAEDSTSTEIINGCTPCPPRTRKLRSDKLENFVRNSPVPQVLSDSQHDDMAKKISNTAVEIGPNKTKIPGHVYYNINWENYRETTRKLLTCLFTRDVLATHSLTGKPSPAFRNQNKPNKPHLDYEKVEDIVYIVTQKCNVDVRTVRSQITMKCADENKMLKIRLEKERQNLKTNDKSNYTLVVEN